MVPIHFPKQEYIPVGCVLPACQPHLIVSLVCGCPPPGHTPVRFHIWEGWVATPWGPMHGGEGGYPPLPDMEPQGGMSRGWVPPHKMLANGQYTSYWNPFLFRTCPSTNFPCPGWGGSGKLPPWTYIPITPGHTHPQKGPGTRDTKPPCGQTDISENITFLQLRWWAVKMRPARVC